MPRKPAPKPQWQIDEENECSRIAALLNIGTDEARSLVSPDSEEQTIRFIRKHLLTTQQSRQLYDRNLTVADLVNGRVEGDQTIYATMFDAWNGKLGKKYFGF